MVWTVDYDSISGAHARRYEEHEYRGVERTLLDFAAGERAGRVLEELCLEADLRLYARTGWVPDRIACRRAVAMRMGEGLDESEPL